MTDADALKIVSQFDQMPEDAILPAKAAAILLGGSLTEQTLRRNPPITKRQISQRRFGFRVGDLRTLIRGKLRPAS
ncbi:MAG TPA: hypothetical protein VGH13_23075 [Xanthobacteraceae bacterium]|jgi:hypothetical protein